MCPSYETSQPKCLRPIQLSSYQVFCHCRLGLSGGPVVIVENGDKISIDVINNMIHLNISDDEIERRLEKWKKPEPKMKRGYVNLYTKLASFADEGAMLRNRLLPCGGEQFNEGNPD
ncbi:MAG: dihydroxy-acid dehydratase [Desulfatiglandales bacterium]